MSYNPKPAEALTIKENAKIKKFTNPSLISEWLAKHKTNEDLIIFHYTDLQGFKGIIENRELWFSHVTSLNDPQELLYGRNIIETEIDKKILSKKYILIKPYLREIKQYLDYLASNIFDFYVSCYCFGGNLLSQWRSYADQGGGYSLGFRLDNNIKFNIVQNAEDITDDIILRKIIYDPVDQKKIVETFLDKYLDVLLSEVNTIKSAEKLLIVAHCLSILQELMICMKHPTFSEESEWRLIYVRKSNNPSEEINFREKENILIPHFKINFYKGVNDDKYFPLNKIRFGPTLEAVRTKASIRLFLEKKIRVGNTIV